MLHIVDGDSALEALSNAQIPGSYLSWLDVLHDGPIPAALSLEDRVYVRATFIAACGWDNMRAVQMKFSKRNTTFEGARKKEPITLWFNAEVFDQLQLLEVLENLHEHGRSEDIFLVQTSQSITAMTPTIIQEHYQNRQPLNIQHLDYAKAVWDAFSAETPEELAQFIEKEQILFPFMNDAIRRFCNQYPSVENGLSKTERRCLQLVHEGVHNVVDLFRSNNELEAIPYMGDASYWLRLADLTQKPHALLQCETGDTFFQPQTVPTQQTFRDQRLFLTDAGLDVFQEQSDNVKLRGIDLWLGGVHLLGTQCWRWNGKEFIWA